MVIIADVDVDVDDGFDEGDDEEDGGGGGGGIENRDCRMCGQGSGNDSLTQ
jgi:hypothetical protein